MTYDSWKCRNPEDETLGEEFEPEDLPKECDIDLREAWEEIKLRVAAFVLEEAAFSKYRDDVVIAGIMTAAEMRRLAGVIRG